MNHFSRLLLPLALAAAIPAQSSLTTTFADNNGRSTAGPATYFDLQLNVGIAIVALDVNIISAAGLNGTVDVYTTALGGTYVGNQTNPSAWTFATSSATFTTAGRGLPTNAPLNTPIVLPPGNYGIAIVYQGVGVAYTNGTGTNQVYSNADMTLTAGSATSAAFSGTLFDPRVFNGTIYYFVGNNYARAVPYGSGCGGSGPALGLRGVARPVLGTTASAETTSIPANSPGGFVLVGFTPIDPGIDLTGIGMPGCFLLVGALGDLAFTPSGPTATHSLRIPNNPTLAGVSVALQSVVVELGANPLSLIASNGLRWVLDVQ